MDDPEERREDPGDHPEGYDWDAWERNRFSGAGRWWLIWALATMAALTALYLSGNSWMSPS